MAISTQAFFIAHSFAEGLPQGNAHIFHGVVAVDVQIACALDVQIYQAVARDLVEHVVKKADTSLQLSGIRAI